MAEMQHYCSACGEIHGGHTGETEAIKIAKINADRDIEVARLARSEARQEIEAETEQTEIMAEAQVDTAIAEAVVTTSILAAEGETESVPDAEPQPDPEPVVIPEALEEEVPAPPETERKAAKTGGGYWDGYATS